MSSLDQFNQFHRPKDGGSSLDRFRRAFPSTKSAGPGPLDDFWYQPISASGISAIEHPVTALSALQLSVAYACAQVLSRPIASLPLSVFRRIEGGKERRDDHEVAQLLRYRPNSMQTAYEFRGQMQWNLVVYNNAFAVPELASDGTIMGVVAKHPCNVSPRFGISGLVYDVRDVRTGTTRTYEAGEVLHLRGLPLSDDGLRGLSPWEVSPSSVSAALAVQDYALRFFRNSGQSGGILEMPAGFENEQQREQFLQAWRRARTGDNAHKDAVLEFGGKYQALKTNNNESQFLETRKQIAVEVCQLFNVPPHKVGILDRATFSNIEHQGLEFVTDTLLPWLVLWEQAIQRYFLAGQDDYFAEFNVAGYLRGDTESRYKAYAIARQWGWLSVNDIRALENQNPIEDGDEYLSPLNMRPAGQEQ